MRRAVVVFALLLAGGFLLWEFLPLQKTVWDGGFELTVTVTNSSPEPIRAVTCQAFGRAEAAREVAEHLLPPETRLWSSTADPFTGEPLIVFVPVSGRDSPLGRELRREQFRYLVVIAEFEGGKRASKLVEIPDGRVSTSVAAAFP